MKSIKWEGKFDSRALELVRGHVLEAVSGFIRPNDNRDRGVVNYTTILRDQSIQDR